MDRKCIKCRAEIKELYPNIAEKKADAKPERGAYLSGVVDKIAVGYGSRFDGDIYIIAVCDKCIEENEDILELRGNYMT